MSMSEKKFGISKNFATLGVLVAVAVMLVIVFGYNTFSGDNSGRPTITEFSKEPLPRGGNKRSGLKQAGTNDQKTVSPLNINADLSKAVLNVKGLSCSSCIQNIKDALSNIEGLEEILLDISRGAAQIYYNSNTLKEPDRLAQAVTARGYPATLVKIYTSEDLRKEEAVAATKSQYYIASVGGWDIARSDLDTQLEHAKKRYEKTYGENVFLTDRGKSLMDNLRAQIASRLIDEGVMMQEITKAGYKVSAAAVEDELQKVVQQSGKELEEFKTALNENGMNFDYFKKRLETQVLISRYLEERILTGASSDVEKQNFFTSWFNNAKILAEVSYYDKDLELLVKQQSSQGKCGG
jgi:copper chaperone CopZ